MGRDLIKQELLYYAYIASLLYSAVDSMIALTLESQILIPIGVWKCNYIFLFERKSYHVLLMSIF
jgi:hypothetical protein